RRPWTRRGADVSRYSCCGNQVGPGLNKAPQTGFNGFSELGIIDTPRKPCFRRLQQQRSADRKPPHERSAGSGAEALVQRGEIPSRSEQQDPPAKIVTSLDDRLKLLVGGRVAEDGQLPPIEPDSQPLDLLDARNAAGKARGI